MPSALSPLQRPPQPMCLSIQACRLQGVDRVQHETLQPLEPVGSASVLGDWFLRLERWLREVDAAVLGGLGALLAVAVLGLIIPLWIVFTSGRPDKPRGPRRAP